ncbi:PREDICTED: signal recognition particle 14 kDa protein-like [Mandrillus leucophaeus]|uniref:signal recognition particle 14 kDa protein-like n=1 Tax=Mandrillus leucophaeus TaxID=9568 RepID=UPI0005F3850C|nr:PREDICTED: signal recognition particle 14 kDa protein-like [Mandrillus leucophaeus]
MVVLESEQFLMELTRLFQKCRTSGSVYITLKKYDGRTKPIPKKGTVEGFEPADNKCLLRATDGKKKISTVVSSKEVSKFQMAHSNLLRANMDGLKKRDKKNKTKKTKQQQQQQQHLPQQQQQQQQHLPQQQQQHSKGHKFPAFTN